MEHWVAYAYQQPFGKRWTSDQARQILGPLLTTPVEKWNDGIQDTSRRIDIFCMLGMDYHEMGEELYKWVMRTLPKWVAPPPPPSQCIVRPPHERDVRAADLHPYIKPLLEKDWEDWDHQEVEPIVELLGGRSSVLAEGNMEAASSYMRFCVPWASYLNAHPKVKARVDPILVIAVVGGGAALPQGFAKAVTNYPGFTAQVPPGGAAVPAGTLPLAPGPHLNGQGYTWNFGLGPVERVTHFIGFMQGAVPGLHFWQINASSPPVYY